MKSNKSKNGIRAFLFRLGLFMLPLVVFIVAPFLWFDPYKIVWHYDEYKTESYDGYSLGMNADVLATRRYLIDREKRRYDSFIFGSSRAMAIRAIDWKGRVPEASPLQFAASVEGLFGIEGKLRLIDRTGDRIKRAILVLEDTVLLGTANTESYLFIKHPLVSGESWLRFYSVMFETYLSRFFFVRYLDLKLFQQYRPYMGRAFSKRRVEFLPGTNDWVLPDEEKRMAENEAGYYEELKANFPARPVGALVHRSPLITQPRQLEQLRSIKSILDKHRADYHVVISPLYDQVALSRDDFALLKQIFGSSRVHDYSGRNALTQDIRNFYDPGHGRPSIGRKILADLYGSRHL